MNKVFLSGNLTRDPEVRYTQSGKALARMGLAVARAFNKDLTDFFNITVWEKQAEFCGRYLKKGSRILVEGRIENDNYEDKNGVKHYSVNIVAERIEFADSKKSDGDSGDNYGGGSRFDDNEPPFDNDADVPF